MRKIQSSLIDSVYSEHPRDETSVSNFVETMLL